MTLKWSTYIHTNIWVPICILCVFSFGPPPPPPPSSHFPIGIFLGTKSRRGRLQRRPEPALRIIKSTSDIQGDDETGIETESNGNNGRRGEIYVCWLRCDWIFINGTFVRNRNYGMEGVIDGTSRQSLERQDKAIDRCNLFKMHFSFISPKYLVLLTFHFLVALI